jgi:hypothetical protein
MARSKRNGGSTGVNGGRSAPRHTAEEGSSIAACYLSSRTIKTDVLGFSRIREFGSHRALLFTAHLHRCHLPLSRAQSNDSAEKSENASVSSRRRASSVNVCLLCQHTVKEARRLTNSASSPGGRVTGSPSSYIPSARIAPIFLRQAHIGLPLHSTFRSSH